MPSSTAFPTGRVLIAELPDGAEAPSYLATSAIPAFFVGTNLVVEAEIQGIFDRPHEGQGTLLTVQGVALAIVLASLGSALLERLWRSRRRL